MPNPTSAVPKHARNGGSMRNGYPADIKLSQGRRKKSAVAKQGNLNDIKAACGLEKPVGGRYAREDFSFPLPSTERNRPIILRFHGVHNDKIALENLGFDIYARLPNIWFIVDTQDVYKEDLGQGGQLPGLGGIHDEYVTQPVPYNFHNAADDAAATMTVLLAEILEGFEEDGNDDPSMRYAPFNDAVIYSIDTEWISTSKMQDVTEVGLIRLDTRDLDSRDINKWQETSNRQSRHLAIMDKPLR